MGGMSINWRSARKAAKILRSRLLVCFCSNRSSSRVFSITIAHNQCTEYFCFVGWKRLPIINLKLHGINICYLCKFPFVCREPLPVIHGKARKRPLGAKGKQKKSFHFTQSSYTATAAAFTHTCNGFFVSLKHFISITGNSVTNFLSISLEELLTSHISALCKERAV